MPNNEIINVRYMVDDVEESIAFYTKLLDFELLTSASPGSRPVRICSKPRYIVPTHQASVTA